MSAPLCTFDSFARATDRLPGHECLRLFQLMPSDLQADAWAVLEQRIECQRMVDGEVDFAERTARPRSSARPRRSRPARRPGDDPLLEVPPAAFVEALTGSAVPERGTMRCPLPGHDDKTPSFRVYETGERGVWCFGCQRGGSIYSFAAVLWGVEPRGFGFVAIRRRLAIELLAAGLA